MFWYTNLISLNFCSITYIKKNKIFCIFRDQKIITSFVFFIVESNLIMKKAFSPKQKPTNMGFVTQPWFVIALVLICFGILTPKIFLPLFMQIFGLNKVDNRNSDRSDPRMRSQGKQNECHL